MSLTTITVAVIIEYNCTDDTNGRQWRPFFLPVAYSGVRDRLVSDPDFREIKNL